VCSRLVSAAADFFAHRSLGSLVSLVCGFQSELQRRKVNGATAQQEDLHGQDGDKQDENGD
jgi:hypothetical protein